MRLLTTLVLLATLAASPACSRSDARTSDEAPSDTLYPAAQSLRRFREPLDPTDHLSPEFASREALARAFVDAVASNDVVAVARTLMTRAEFAWLYYPENPISRPPYELPAGLAWFELEGNSLAGVRRALAIYGGRPATFQKVECGMPAVMQGANRLWNRCVVSLRVADEGDTSVRIFGTILERGGRFKIASAANDL